jgi:transposase-like protein
MTRGRYSEEVHAACVAALLAGQDITEIAGAYNVPETTLRSWKHRARQAGTEPIVAETDRAEIGQLLIAYLKDVIGAMRKQTVVFGDEEYLRKQPAGELGVVHGILADKTIRLLEALEAGSAVDADAAEVTHDLPEQPRPVSG